MEISSCRLIKAILQNTFSIQTYNPYLLGFIMFPLYTFTFTHRENKSKLRRRSPQ